MARDFKAEEEQLDAWFDEEKEKLAKKYFKKIDAARRGHEQEEKKKAKKGKDASEEDFEKEFLAESRKLRHEYQKKYDSIRAAREKHEKRKKTVEVVSKPAGSVLGKCWHYLKRALIWLWAIIKKIFGGAWKGTVSVLDEAWFRLKEYYMFHTRSKVMPFYRPARKVFMFFLKPLMNFVSWLLGLIKKGLKELVKSLGKLWETTLKYSKKTAGFASKHYKTVSGAVAKAAKKIKAFSDKYIKPVLKPVFAVFKKKEKEE